MEINRVGFIDHPLHGKYFIHFSEGCFGLTKDEAALVIHCGYATLEALFKVKGL